jgi:hypothetical protein
MTIIKAVSAQDGLKRIEGVVKGLNKPFSYGSIQPVVILLKICIESIRLYRCKPRDDIPCILLGLQHIHRVLPFKGRCLTTG